MIQILHRLMAYFASLLLRTNKKLFLEEMFAIFRNLNNMFKDFPVKRNPTVPKFLSVLGFNLSSICNENPGLL